MRRYLATLHNKPESHKKRFAFISASVVTLFIIGIWSLTIFGVEEELSYNTRFNDAKKQEVSPFQSLRMNLGTSFESLKGDFQGVIDDLDSLESKIEYQTYEQ
ncbi:MAG: hypothetical protein UT07_C0006G0010 [Parcubacteria group bacterium GW2011_GWB1_38_8]|uniref:Uncharacterized protein n=1 Tax=Candidatus Zambryskibacteria bacterium RIFCSPLOWO2_02_FULL_39_14 TaxID=1802769 RepID=A0A1G2UGJ2_9BACT|nr:MAG: hypothetical protein UT07_C0006G0010 [Parcubacteria group bacterium GW2011_GWB1_38_8]OHA94711.1 MAG: hypothetical protein A3C62_00075 [Candidatus Zambryskibacteria bacterium RIFCSPHIGHO2_02_FULL_39_16]OHB08536.1 MAG: hypothetical protein A3I86_02700 [Candidatus Zambryskibacteria bacterium RIFCSPLOWO2_02_FULL_39_14]